MHGSIISHLRTREAQVVDALRLGHTIFSIFQGLAHYKAASTIGETNAITIRSLQDHSVHQTRDS